MFETKGDKYLFDIEDFKNDTNTFIVFNEQKEQAEEFIHYIKDKGINVVNEDMIGLNFGDEGIVMCIGDYSGRLRIYYKEEIDWDEYEFIPYDSLIFEEEKRSKLLKMLKKLKVYFKLMIKI